MKPMDILTALGETDARYITEAIHYRKPKRIRRFLPLAACLLAAVLVTLVYFRSQIGYTDGGCLAEEGTGNAEYSPSEDHGSYAGAPLAPESETGTEDGYYDIVRFMADGEPMEYEPAPLWIATTSDDAMDAYVSDVFGRDLPGIALFTAGGEDPSGAPRWYALRQNGLVAKFYWFTKTEKSGYSRGWTDGNQYETAFNVLAPLTSEETPLYLVRSQDMLFAVIGNTAYYLPGSAFEPEKDRLAHIRTDDYEIKVICLE